MQWHPSVYIVRKLNAPNSPAVQRVVNVVRKTIAKHKWVECTARNQVQPNSLVIAVGGDGTMLEAMLVSAEYNAVAVGINLGKVGFLTDLSASDILRNYDLDNQLDRIFLQTNVSFENRSILRVQTPTTTKLAVNEVAISSIMSDTMVDYKLKVGNYDAGFHRANSLLISTATGSTAYNLSAGGALMVPDVGAVQITPVAPTRLTSRPLISSRRLPITIEAWGESISVRADGQSVCKHETVTSSVEPYRLVVETFSKEARMVHLGEWNYFQVLNDKLGWMM